jgi:3-methyladenine DNA glycosylase AlkD
MTYEEVMSELKKMASPNKKDLEGMARFGIDITNAWCISAPNIRKVAKKIGKDHVLAIKLWDSGIHEARWLVSLVAEPEKLTKKQAETWARESGSWDICDSLCMNLFDRTPFAYESVLAWSKKKDEFLKRAGFATMAMIALHDKTLSDEKFDPFFEAIKREATDERNYVKKAVNWALRQIGKGRNIKLYKKALKTANEILKDYPDSKSANFIAKDTIRELTTSKYVLRKFGLI